MNMVITVLEHLHIQEIILIFMFKGAKNGQGDFLYDVEISRKWICKEYVIFSF